MTDEEHTSKIERRFDDMGKYTYRAGCSCGWRYFGWDTIYFAKIVIARHNRTQHLNEG
jgi:hypothetical protein